MQQLQALQSIKYASSELNKPELDFQVDIKDARKAMDLAAAKLPIKCKFVERNI